MPDAHRDHAFRVLRAVRQRIEEADRHRIHMIRLAFMHGLTVDEIADALAVDGDDVREALRDQP